MPLRHCTTRQAKDKKAPSFSEEKEAKRLSSLGTEL
jgi:hypothetical protein